MNAISKCSVFLGDALLLMFVFLSYFLQNARRDTAIEKEFDIENQIKLDMFYFRDPRK